MSLLLCSAQQAGPVLLLLHSCIANAEVTVFMETQAIWVQFLVMLLLVAAGLRQFGVPWLHSEWHVLQCSSSQETKSLP